MSNLILVLTDFALYLEIEKHVGGTCISRMRDFILVLYGDRHIGCFSRQLLSVLGHVRPKPTAINGVEHSMPTVGYSSSIPM